MTSEREPLPRRVFRAYLRCAVPCIVLGLILFGLLYLVFLPRSGAKIDLGRARSIVAAQWVAPVVVVHAVLVMSGILLPWVRGDRPRRAAWISVSTVPAVWLHVVVAQLMVVLGLVAGVVPGLLALAPAALVAAAVADGTRGRAAFDAASVAIAPRRWQIATLVVGLIALEIILTWATWKAIVPPLGKKTPQVGLLATARFAWTNAIRAAITAPLVATLFAALYDSWRPQPASAARTAPASAHATTS